MHPLELILQLQVGTDQTAVLYLPSIVSSLTVSHFEPSPHLRKWIMRVTSLIQSKHPGARWAGLCLALQSSTLNQGVMMESAQNWITVTLPMLSRNEIPSIWKACIRLLEFIFASTVNLPEFQRQLATPNVPKFSAALLNFAENTENDEIRHISLTTLTQLIPLYPNLHRQFHASLSSLSFRLLSGSSTTQTPLEKVTDACNLHGVLHFTGGKVGAAPLWRKSLDIALANAWSAFTSLRITFPQPAGTNIKEHSTFDPVPLDPVVAVPLSLDRLKSSVTLISHLLRAVTSRPVPVPIGELNKLAVCLLRCKGDDTVDAYFDPSRRALELSVLPEIWRTGYELVAELSRSLRHKLTPHIPRLLSHIIYHLEQSLPRSQRIWFLRPLPFLLSRTHPLHSSILSTRLVKIILPLLANLLPSRSETKSETQGSYTATSKKRKKRTTGFEGDEVFKVGRGVLCPTVEDIETLDVALETLDSLLSIPDVAPPVRTLTERLLVALLYELPRHSPPEFSIDLSFHGYAHAKILSLCHKHVLAGSSGWVNAPVVLIVNALNSAGNGNETAFHSTVEAQRRLEQLLHPRLPPLLRSQPPIEALSLFRSGNSKDDKAARDAVGLSDDDAQSASETRITGVTTEHQNNTQSLLVTTQQSWTIKDTAPAIPPVVSVASTTVVERPEEATPTENIQLSFPTEKKTEASQQNVGPSSRYSEPLRGRQVEDSDSEEEMPEIDMRSDSD